MRIPRLRILACDSTLRSSQVRKVNTTGNMPFYMEDSEIRDWVPWLLALLMLIHKHAIIFWQFFLLGCDSWRKGDIFQVLNSIAIFRVLPGILFPILLMTFSKMFGFISLLQRERVLINNNNGNKIFHTFLFI